MPIAKVSYRSILAETLEDLARLWLRVSLQLYCGHSWVERCHFDMTMELDVASVSICGVFRGDRA